MTVETPEAPLLTWQTHTIQEPAVPVEGDLCVLDSGIAVIGYLETDHYAIHLTAFDVSSGTLTPGPKTIQNLSTWDEDLLTEGWPADPYGGDYGLYNDMSRLIPLGDYTFALCGSPTSEHNADGSPVSSGGAGGYIPLAAIYQVDPDTLAITRTAVHFGPYLNAWASEPTFARWGEDRLMLLDCSTNRWWTIHRDTGFMESGLVDTEQSFPSQVMISGDIAYFWCRASDSYSQGYTLFSLNLLTKDLTKLVLVPEMGTGNYSFQGWLMDDGRVLYSTGLFPPAAGQAPFSTVILRDGVIEEIVPFDGSYSPGVGWTGGWFSNLRAVGAWPDGSVFVSFLASYKRFEYAARRADGSFVQESIAGLVNHSSTGWMSVARMAPHGESGAFALLMGRTWQVDEQGQQVMPIYVAYGAGVVTDTVISGNLDLTRRSFT